MRRRRRSVGEKRSKWHWRWRRRRPALDLEAWSLATWAQSVAMRRAGRDSTLALVPGCRSGAGGLRIAYAPVRFCGGLL